MGFAQRKDDQHYTYADYCRWDDGQRWELIDGVAYLMAPAPSAFHQIMAFQIGHQVEQALKDKPCTVMLAPVVVRLPRAGTRDDSSDIVVQPDLLVVCDPAKLDAKGVKGVPDWIVEVLSPKTAGYDQIVKREIYERAGVPEYWLVHPVDRILTIYRLENGRYGMPDIRELVGQTPVGPLPGATVDWQSVLDRLPVLDE
jgi:Uma2 family endonuclease